MASWDSDGPFARIKGKIRVHQLPPPIADVLAFAQKVQLLMIKGFGSAEKHGIIMDAAQGRRAVKESLDDSRFHVPSAKRNISN